jgi:hypothetical protein
LRAEPYGEIMRQAPRLWVEGPRGPSDGVLLRAADAMQGVIEGRLEATALEPFQVDILPNPGGMGR